MDDDPLDLLARAYGIARHYTAIDGACVRVSDEMITAILAALGVDAHDGKARLAALAAAPRGDARLDEPLDTNARCHMPPVLEHGRAWGITCQAYGLVSRRNWGIGDFEDVARLAELAGSLGADFVGLNPLHALFLAEPARTSPFSPSSRSYLNPLFIAVDRVAGFDPSRNVNALALAQVRAAPLVDYPGVGALKLSALRSIFTRTAPHGRDAAFARFREDGGEALRLHATFEAIGLDLARAGYGSGWHCWPGHFRDPRSTAVAEFCRQRAEEIEFHIWLQWLADTQLAQAAARGRAAGLRIGLYLDLAVGVAPDGSATWSDRRLTIPGVEIGAPPDMFNAQGQNWGLAPMAPAEIAGRGFEPARHAYRAVMRHAGALRIDHAMSLSRLYWIPAGFPATDGTYAAYPAARMIETLAAASREHATVVIGEDLGVVPDGFRAMMQAAGMLGYRIFQFERENDNFRSPHTYPADALACLGSHDTATFAGWWRGHDIGIRHGIGLMDDAGAATAKARREHERAQLSDLLRAEGLTDGDPARDVAAPAAAVHALVARSPSRLFAAQIEDLLDLVDQANVPGTTTQHPNWRRRLPVAIEDLSGHAGLRAIVAAIADERPREP